MTTDADTPRPHVVVRTWRDRWNPDAGGAEVWLREVTERLVGRGWDVTVLTAAYPGRPADEVVAGVRYRRRGGRTSQYVRAHLGLRRLHRRPDVVLDVFNGVPFLSVLTGRTPVVVVVHHVHREQWRMVFGRALGSVGWQLEQAAGRLQRELPHVTVSSASARALVDAYGVAADHVAVARNGGPDVPETGPADDLVPATSRFVVVGRLVPHKRVEVAIAAVAAARERGLDAHLDVVGAGEWLPDLEADVARRGMAQHVTFHGWVDEVRKHAILAASDVALLPSVREGWGIVVVEAAAHGVPTVALASAGGPTESIVAGITGELAHDDDDLVRRAVDLLQDPARRASLGAAARRLAQRWTWEECAATVDATLRQALRPGPVSGA